MKTESLLIFAHSCLLPAQPQAYQTGLAAKVGTGESRPDRLEGGIIFPDTESRDVREPFLRFLASLSNSLETASAVFRRAIDQILARLDDCLVYLDDMRAQLTQSTANGFTKYCPGSREWGFRLGLAKYKFDAKAVKYLRCIVDKDGIRADPRKVKAVREIPRPSNM